MVTIIWKPKKVVERGVSVRKIPKGMIFTGRIANYCARLFIKGTENVIALSTGDEWGACVMVKDYKPVATVITVNTVQSE